MAKARRFETQPWTTMRFICLQSARLRSELDAFMPIRLSTAQRKRLCRAGGKAEGLLAGETGAGC